MRTSFVFYGSWWEAVKNLPRDVQGDVLTALVEYGLTGKTTGELNKTAKLVLTMAKAQMDVNRQRYENGKKGGRPEKTGNQNETKPKPNVNDNANENENENVNVKKETHSDECAKKAPDPPLEPTNYERFLNWMEANTPNVLKMRRGITEQEFEKMHERYTYVQIIEILQQMENHKGLAKKYVSAYLTFVNWAKREYGG